MDWTGLVRHHIDLKLPLIFIRGSQGLLGCGYFAVATFDRTGEAGVVVRGVNSFDDMLRAVVAAGDISKAAADLGVEAGMSGSRVLEILR